MAFGDQQGSDLLTFGEAAEFAGVSLLDLRERLRASGVPAVWGWRAGAAVHLVPMQGLLRTFPNLAGKTRLPGLSLEARGIRVMDEPAPTPAPEPKAPVVALVAPREVAEKPAKQVMPQEAGPIANPELDKLYGEIETAAEHNAKLMAELSDAGTGLNKLLDEIQQREHAVSQTATSDPGLASPEGLNKIQQWNELEQEQERIEKERRRGQHLSWGLTALLASVVVILITFKGKDLLLASSGPDAATAFPIADPERYAAQTPQFTLKTEVDAIATEEQTLWDSDVNSAALPIDRALVSFADATGNPESEYQMDAVDGLTPSPILLDDSEDEQELVPLTPEPTAEVAVSTDTVLDTVGGPDKPKGNPPLAPAVLSKEAPCLYAKLTAPGQELRSVLGACIGPWNESANAVAGGFRHSGERYCRHHLIVAKDLGGSVDRARNIASYARQEGLLPPLLRLRVEHGAADLLQKRVGKWIESGFEAGLSGQHKVTASDTADQWTIQSWVRLQSQPGALANLRYFTMELELAADKGRDRWISFDWTQKP